MIERERPAQLKAGNDAPRDTGTTQDRTGSRARINSGEMAVKAAAVYFVRGAWLIHTQTGEATPQPANREKVFVLSRGAGGQTIHHTERSAERAAVHLTGAAKWPRHLRRPGRYSLHTKTGPTAAAGSGDNSDRIQINTRPKWRPPDSLKKKIYV